jgi:hypothetical protein
VELMENERNYVLRQRGDLRPKILSAVYSVLQLSEPVFLLKFISWMSMN